MFGQDNERSKQDLMSLLNAILERKDDPITAIRILTPIVIGQTDTSKGGISRRVPTLRSNSFHSLLSVSSANRFRSLDEKAWLEKRSRELAEHTRDSELYYAREEGLEEGEASGRAAERIEMAKAMKARVLI